MNPGPFALPKLELVRDKESFVLKYSLQNTQGVFSIFRADTPERLRWLGQPMLTGPIPPIRQSGSLLGIASAQTTGFFLLAEYPEVIIGDFEVPGAAEEESSPSALGYVATRGVPVPLPSGQSFSCSFILAGSDGLPMAVNGVARLVLLDSAGQAVTFAYSINPSSLSFVNGIAQAILTVSTTQSLAGFTLALTAEASPRPQAAEQGGPITRKSLPTTRVTLSDILGTTPVQTTPQPSPLDLNPSDPNFGSKLVQALEDLRRTAGIANPVWGYPLVGGRRPIVGNFGEWYRSGGRIHAGLDLADGAGTKVVAAERGLVTSVKASSDDSYVVIDHGYGVWTLYQHVYATGPQCKVKVNDPVAKGQELTQILDYGPAGAQGDHLHFGIRRARNPGENQIQFGGQPGKAVNPARDLNFGDTAFALPKPAPAILSVVVTPFQPYYVNAGNVAGAEKKASFLDFLKYHPRPTSIYVQVQVVERAGDYRLAPYRVTWRATGSTPSMLEITFDDLDQAGAYIPGSVNSLSDRGIARYSVENLASASVIPPAQKYRYWFEWKTSAYASEPAGPREFTVQADDGLGQSSDLVTFRFGPRIKSIESVADNRFRLVVEASLGSPSQPQFRQVDQYELAVTRSDPTAVPGVPGSGTTEGFRTRVFTRHLEEESYTLTLPTTMQTDGLKVRVSSLLVPDIAHEIPVQTQPTKAPVPIPVQPSVAPIPIERIPTPGMVKIPAGTFVMGSPATEKERDSFETQHTVTLTKDFYMSKYEVTQKEYLAVMGNNPSAFTANLNPLLNLSTEILNRPVEQVSWFDATSYCEKLTASERATGRLPGGWVYRLPTEAEWEYACRAGSTTPFHYGPDLRSGMANFDCRYEYAGGVGTANNPNAACLDGPTVVGRYAPNAFGLYDMHGNVWEWCLDSWGERKFIRGGGWYTRARACRSSVRGLYSPDYRDFYSGFRPVLAPGQP